VQNVPSVLWNAISLTPKTCCDPVWAGVPGILPVGTSYRWHLNE
jgi:hypothetical protein